MPKLSADDIAEALGTAKPEKVAPTGRAGLALSKISELDGKMDKLVERFRRDGEGHAQAASRIYGENPDLIRVHKAEKARILREHGMGADAAAGGL